MGKLPNGRKSAEEMTEERRLKEEEIHKAGKRFVSLWLKSANLDGHCEIQVFDSPEFASGLEQLKEILAVKAFTPEAREFPLLEFRLLEHGGRLALVKATRNVLVAAG